jgi:hypothetical protein
MTRKPTRLETVNTLAKYWLVGTFIESVSNHFMGYGTKINFNPDTTLSIESDWTLADGHDFSKIQRELSLLLRGEEAAENRSSNVLNAMRLSLVSGTTEAEVSDVAIDENYTLTIFFLHGMVLTVAAKSATLYEDDDFDTDAWNLARWTTPEELCASLPTYAIAVTQKGVLHGSWDPEEPYRDFAGGELGVVLPHRYPKASVKLLFNAREYASQGKNDETLAHVMLGYLDVAKRDRSDFLSENKIDEDALRQFLLDAAPKGELSPAFPKPLKSPLRELSVVAWNEARQLDYEEVLPDHLLLAILLSSDPIVEKGFEKQHTVSAALCQKLRDKLRKA